MRTGLSLGRARRPLRVGQVAASAVSYLRTGNKVARVFALGDHKLKGTMRKMGLRTSPRATPAT